MTDALEARLQALELVVERWTGTLATVPTLSVVVAGMREQIREIRDAQPGGGQPQPGRPRYRIAAQPRWDDAGSRRAAAERIGRWVQEVYRPQYTAGRALATCWADHLPVLVVLDVLCELHALLTFGDTRTYGVLAGQAELYVRTAREAEAVIATELRGCAAGHTAPALNGGRYARD